MDGRPRWPCVLCGRGVELATEFMTGYYIHRALYMPLNVLLLGRGLDRRGGRVDGGSSLPAYLASQLPGFRPWLRTQHG